MRTSILLATLVTSALASNHKGMQHKVKRGSSYTLDSFLQGDSLLSAFTFAEATADNGGAAQYVSESVAKASKLVQVGNDNAVHLRVEDTKTVSGQRKAIKLTSTDTSYGVGDLIIFDTARQPQVCGVWPALWMTGPDWPSSGEIDVLEYVSLETTASMSVHSGAGCSMGTTGYSGVQMLTGSAGLDCDANANSDQGCGIRSSQTNSTGQGVNWNGGGVYAVEIASSGISIWAFKRNDVPKDIASKSPNPSSWTTPDLFLAASGCSPISNYFHDLQIVINTDLCGDWAEGVWNDNLSYSGQILPGSCASQTGYSTCAAYVAAEGQDFKHAYWKINSLAIYKS